MLRASNIPRCRGPALVPFLQVFSDTTGVLFGSTIEALATRLGLPVPDLSPAQVCGQDVVETVVHLLIIEHAILRAKRMHVR